jgi:hypothetical protein
MKRVFVLLTIVGLAISIRVTRLSAVEEYRAGQRYEDVYYLPPSQWMPVMSIGYQAALADLLWCRSLVYFGEQLIRQGHVDNLFNYADSIIILDPDFKAVYGWTTTAAMFRSGKADVDEDLRAVNYTRMAVKRWPSDGELAWHLGSALRYELMPELKGRPELRKKVAEEAAEQMASAAALGAGPPWLALNSADLLTKLGKKELALRNLQEVYATVQDPETKQLIAQQLATLRTQTYVEAMREANEQLEQQHMRSFPYVSPSLFMLLGPRAEMSRAQLLARKFLPEDRSEQVLEAE